VASARSGGDLGRLRALFDVGTMAGLTDGQLLDRFAAGPAEAAELAFAALVERHGPMVMRTCAHALRDRHDAEDVFQATFLVLARRGATIRRGDSVGCWLHGVALRVASNARAAARRRRLHEERKAGSAAVAAPPDRGAGDLGRALHEELDRLPARLRDAAVLVLLEGCSHEEAALRLGRPIATVRSRLASARGRLRVRLTRRGLAPAALTAALAAEAGAARVGLTARLMDATIRSVIGYAAGGAEAGVVPAGVAALTRGVIVAMMIQKLKVLAVTAAAVGLIGISIGRGQQPSRPDVTLPDQGERLGSMERKLDRLLEAMGNPGGGVAPSAPGATQYVPEKAKLTISDMTQETTTLDSPVAARLGRLERRVSGLERELAAQARRLAALEASWPKPSDRPGATNSQRPEGAAKAFFDRGDSLESTAPVRP
jgi:RNA polymerase sigma factor (sigma-70 family)